ncbi:MAG: S8 family peptidase, partial [Synergistaceae bacterium]|nr:S8 family peptidase [Synergistaceae bacterium]
MPVYPHIFLRETQENMNFTSPRQGGAPLASPPRDRQEHSARLRQRWENIWAEARERRASAAAVAMPVKDGIYVEFEGQAGYELTTKSLEDRTAGIRLLSVYTVASRSESAQEIMRATVFIPSGEQNRFLRKINEYAQAETRDGNPRHATLVQSVEDFRVAVLESFWRDDVNLMPRGTTPVWCEIWLQGTGDDLERRFRETAATLAIEIQARSLRFPERTVLLGRATCEQLGNLMEASPDIAEFRRAKETARFFLELENREQTEWVTALQSSLRINPETNVSVCILDTGANNGHALLQPVLADEDRHAVDPSWGVNDHNGHGTLMCGVVAYGDLTESLQHVRPIQVNHCLESAKILPPSGSNDPDLYGDITIQGMSRAEIQAPDRYHIGCMAVTSEDGRDRGRPSSWSAAIDKFTSGYDDDKQRLFVVSAGNVPENEWGAYPHSNLSCSVHDPGQSWNALTVGAYTEKVLLTAPDFQGHIPLAQPSELSPFSTTSQGWEGKWPIKPDIVLEGGNLARGTDGFISVYDDLSLLSTGYQPTQRQLDAFNATSAATALAARMAAQIQARYPQAWPETIRGLLIHSAEWPDAIKRQFLNENGNSEYSRS